MIHDEVGAGQDRDGQDDRHRKDVAVVVGVGELVGQRRDEEPEERHGTHEGGRRGHEDRHEDEDCHRCAPVVKTQVCGGFTAQRENG